MYVRSTQAVKSPATAPTTTNGRSGTTSRRPSRRPRFHQSTTSSAPGSVAVTDLLSRARHEQRRRRRVGPPGPLAIESQVGESRCQEEHPRQRVLELGDPRHGLHVHGVEREHDGRQRRAGHVQPPQDHPQEAGREHVQEDVDQVVAEGRISPEPMLDPEGGVDQGVVLCGRPELEPDPPQPLHRTQGDRGHVALVVPDHPALPGRVVSGQRGQKESGDAEPRQRVSRSRGAAVLRRRAVRLSRRPGAERSRRLSLRCRHDSRCPAMLSKRTGRSAFRRPGPLVTPGRLVPAGRERSGHA